MSNTVKNLGYFNVLFIFYSFSKLKNSFSKLIFYSFSKLKKFQTVTAKLVGKKLLCPIN